MRSRSMPSNAISKSASVSTAMPRQVEGDVQARLAVGDQVAEALVGVRRIAEAGVLPHRVRPLPVHERMNAAHERVRAGLADEAEAAARLDVARRVDRPGLAPRLRHP